MAATCQTGTFCSQQWVNKMIQKLVMGTSDSVRHIYCVLVICSYYLTKSSQQPYEETEKLRNWPWSHRWHLGIPLLRQLPWPDRPAALNLADRSGPALWQVFLIACLLQLTVCITCHRLCLLVVHCTQHQRPALWVLQNNSLKCLIIMNQ